MSLFRKTGGPTLVECNARFSDEMERVQWQPTTKKRYRRELERFADHTGGDTPIVDVDANACRSFLDTFNHLAPGTAALEHSILSSYFRWLALDEVIDVSPMGKVRRPKVPALRDRKRTRVTTEQVQQMLAECKGWPETICLNFLAYTGTRRHAASEARWGDVDGKKQTITFKEKGAKRIEKPMALELRKVLTSYVVATGPKELDAHIIPNRRATKTGERGDRLIYDLTKGVAGRCGIDAHVHAFRAAFAVHFLRTNPQLLENLRQLMGHSSIGTTQHYLSELEGEDAMREVESLSFRVLGVSS